MPPIPCIHVSIQSRTVARLILPPSHPPSHPPFHPPSHSPSHILRLVRAVFVQHLCAGVSRRRLRRRTGKIWFELIIDSVDNILLASTEFGLYSRFVAGGGGDDDDDDDGVDGGVGGDLYDRSFLIVRGGQKRSWTRSSAGSSASLPLRPSPRAPFRTAAATSSPRWASSGTPPSPVARASRGRTTPCAASWCSTTSPLPSTPSWTPSTSPRRTRS